MALAIQHWRPYLLGRKFVVSSDQKSLKEFFRQKIVTGDQQNWAAKLLGYNFDIEYKPGKTNRGADALSRIAETEALGEEPRNALNCSGETGALQTLMSYPRWDDYDQIQEEVQADVQLAKIVAELQLDPQSHPGYTLSRGVLLYHQRLVLSGTSSLIPRMLEEYHSTPQGGHSGFLRTYRRIAANLY